MAQEMGSAPDVTRARWVAVLLALWPLMLAFVLLAPLLTGSGYPLARDLIFVPHQPLNDAAWGLVHGPPRSVPLDAAVALLSRVVDGGLLARIVLPLTLAVVGWGVARLVAPLGRVAQFAAVSWAVWNAYAVERLALGQWALLLAYAALPWILMAAGRFRREGRTRDAGAAIAWAALASLTPTGGLLALGGLVAAGLGRTRRTLMLLLGGIALQSPWVVAGFASEGGLVSDPAGVAAFAPDTDAPWGSAVALLGLGGIWDSGAEPATRTTWLALMAAGAVVLVLVAGWSGLRQVWGSGEMVRWMSFAGVMAVLALAATTPTGRVLLEWAISTVPGAGLLRDTQKFMAPAALVVSAAFGAAAARCVEMTARLDIEIRTAALLPIVATPFLLLPDATTVTWPTVRPVHYPSGFEAVGERLVSAKDYDVLVTLPWRSYRAFDWSSHGLTSSDPALRWFDADVVTSDDLQVGPTLVAGESDMANRVQQGLGSGLPGRTLGPLGVSWVIIYLDDPDAGAIDRTGLVPVYADADLELFSVPAARHAPSAQPGQRICVLGAHALWLATLIVGLATALRCRRPTRQIVR